MIFIVSQCSKFLIIFTLMSVSPGQPISISDDTEVVDLVGNSHDLAKHINQKEVHWGVSLNACFSKCLRIFCLRCIICSSYIKFDIAGPVGQSELQKYLKSKRGKWSNFVVDQVHCVANSVMLPLYFVWLW